MKTVNTMVELDECLFPVIGFEDSFDTDYEGAFAFVVGLRGCNFDCQHCFVGGGDLPRELYTLSELKRYAASGLYDAVVITGGEPTIHPEKVYSLCTVLREESPDLKIKILTNGSHPDFLETLIEEGLVDALGISIKHPLDLNIPAPEDYFQVLAEILLFTGKTHQACTLQYIVVETAAFREDLAYRTFVWEFGRSFGVDVTFIQERAEDGSKCLN